MEISRREFCGFVGLGMTGLAGCATAPRLMGTLTDGVITVPRPTVAEPVVVTAAGFSERIVLLPSDDGSYRAMSARCTHLGCDVVIGKGNLICPCHNSVFDFAGSVVRGPANEPLKEFPVEAHGESVTIRVF